MTPAEAAARWRLSAGDINSGHAVDYICPSCGSRAAFRVGARGTVTITGQGVTTGFNDIELGTDDYCQCVACDHDGAVPKFKVVGLDAYLIKEAGL